MQSYVALVGSLLYVVKSGETRKLVECRLGTPYDFHPLWGSTVLPFENAMSDTPPLLTRISLPPFPSCLALMCSCCWVGSLLNCRYER